MSAEKERFPLVGQSVPDPDALEKATGILPFSDDILMPGMLHGRVLRSPHANARIRKVEVRKARALPGVHAVLTAENIPGVNLRGNFPGDRDDQPEDAGPWQRAETPQSPATTTHGRPGAAAVGRFRAPFARGFGYDDHPIVHRRIKS